MVLFCFSFSVWFYNTTWTDTMKQSNPNCNCLNLCYVVISEGHGHINLSHQFQRWLTITISNSLIFTTQHEQTLLNSSIPIVIVSIYSYLVISEATVTSCIICPTLLPKLVIKPSLTEINWFFTAILIRKLIAEDWIGCLNVFITLSFYPWQVSKWFLMLYIPWGGQEWLLSSSNPYWDIEARQVFHVGY